MFVKILLLYVFLQFFSSIHSHCQNEPAHKYVIMRRFTTNTLRHCAERCHRLTQCNRWRAYKVPHQPSALRCALFRKRYAPGARRPNCPRDGRICIYKRRIHRYKEYVSGTPNCGDSRDICRIESHTRYVGSNTQVQPTISSYIVCGDACYKTATCNYWNFTAGKCFFLETLMKTEYQKNSRAGTKICGALE